MTSVSGTLPVSLNLSFPLLIEVYAPPSGHSIIDPSLFPNGYFHFRNLASTRVTGELPGSLSSMPFMIVLYSSQCIHIQDSSYLLILGELGIRVSLDASQMLQIIILGPFTSLIIFSD